MVVVDASPDATEISLDGVFDEDTCIRYIGTARRGFDGTWKCAAVVGNALCLVEVRVRPTVHVDADPGDEQPT